MWEDPIVSEVRRAREQLSARFDFDLKAIFADLRNRQAALGDRLVRQSTTAEPKEARQQTQSPVLKHAQPQLKKR